MESITVFPETSGGVSLNVLLFILPIAFSGFIIYMLVRSKLRKLVRYLVRIALFITLSFLIEWYCEYAGLALSRFFEALWLPLMLATSFLVVLCFSKTKGWMRMVITSLIGAMIGTFLGASIPMLTGMVLLATLAAYDAYSVFRGPIGKIAQLSELDDLEGAVCSLPDVSIGMGDLVFYSMLVSSALLNLGILAFFGSSLGVILGSFTEFKMLEKREVFPGLPLAVLLGMVLMLASFQLQGMLGFA
jgi:presenilin-like A22 family membrane protease